MKPITATVMARSIAYGQAQEADVSYSSAGTLFGYFVPTGGEIVQKVYGTEYAGEFEFYTKKRNSALIAGNRLQIGGVDYEIVAVRDYVKAIMVLLTKAVS